jgi:hypothetical protein
MSSQPPFDPPPPLCGHKDVEKECTAECAELTRKFEEWMRRQMLPPPTGELQ